MTAQERQERFDQLWSKVTIGQASDTETAEFMDMQRDYWRGLPTVEERLEILEKRVSTTADLLHQLTTQVGRIITLLEKFKIK